MNADELAIINPTSRTCPVFRSQEDKNLTKKISAPFPIIASQNTEDGWRVTYQIMFMMNEASKDFVELAPSSGPVLSKDGILVPLYEGKFISHYDHRFGSYGRVGIDKGKGGRGLPYTPIECYEDPAFGLTPRYWIDKKLVEDRLYMRWKRNWLISWRDVTSEKLERTIVATIITRYGVGHAAPIIFIDDRNVLLSGCILANLNSLTLDYVARQKVAGAHLTFGYMDQLPIVSTSFYQENRVSWVNERVVELIYTSNDVQDFARDLGHDGPPFPWDEDRRAVLRADLDAFYARAYGLTRDELRYILDPADVKGADYPSETFRVLKEKEIRQYGEYRTRRLVLAAWDRMEANGEFKAMGI